MPSIIHNCVYKMITKASEHRNIPIQKTTYQRDLKDIQWKKKRKKIPKKPKRYTKMELKDKA